MINLKLKSKDKYSKFYIYDFINDFENKIKGKIFKTDEEAEQFYISKYGNEEYKSSLHAFKLNNSVNRLRPTKLTTDQKIKLLLLLKETDCNADIYMSYQDIIEMKKDTNE